MMFLINELVPCLLLAALIGSILGWFLRKCKQRDNISHTTDIDATEQTGQTAIMKEVQDDDNDKSATLSIASSVAGVAGATYVASHINEETKIDPLEDENIQLRYKLSAAELEAKTARMKTEALEDQYQTKLKDAADSFYNRDGYIQELQTKLDKHTRELTSLKEDLEKEKASKLNSDTEITRLKDEIQKYKRIEEEKIALERKYQKEHDDFTTKFSALSTNSQDYEQSVKRLESELTTLKQEKQALEQKYKTSGENAQHIEQEFNSLKENLEKEKASKQNSDTEITRLKDEIQKYKLLEEEKIALERKYQKEHDDFTTKFSALSTSSQDYEQSVKRLESELTTLKQEKQALEQKYKTSGENAQHIEQEFNSLKENLEKEKASKLSTYADIARLKGEIERYKLLEEEKIALERKYQKEHDDFTTKFSALSTSSQDYEQNVKRLESEVTDLKSKLSDNENLKNNITLVQPKFLTSPKMGKSDDLTLINGIGDKLNKRLNGLGVYHFSQIAAWNEQEVAWINEHLAFSGRIQREEWIPQAKLLIKEGDNHTSKQETDKEASKDKHNEPLKRHKHTKRLRKK